MSAFEGIADAMIVVALRASSVSCNVHRFSVNAARIAVTARHVIERVDAFKYYAHH